MSPCRSTYKSYNISLAVILIATLCLFSTQGSAQCANLTPYQPSGWDNKIVLSTVTGTNTSASSISSNQTIYVDWAIINNGSCNITQSFVTKVYLDNVLINTASTAGLNAGFYASLSDMTIGPLAAGNHTVQITVDGNVNVSETNELDNSYVRSFTVTAPPCVNLIAYQPGGWDDKIVLSTTTGTNTTATSFLDNQTIYVDFATLNNGSCNITQSFATKLYVDGVLQNTYTYSSLNSNVYIPVTDFAVGPLAAGSHTFLLVLDANGSINETNESDNSWQKSINISAAPCVNLLPYQSIYADNKIVLSTVTGTGVSASTITNSQTIYVDWSVLNSGSCNISQSFVTKMYLDNTLIGTYSTAGLTSGSYASVSDLTIGPLAAGNHTIQITTDGDANVSETNELDNSYVRAFTVIAPCANLTTYQPGGWGDKIVLSTTTGTNTSASTFGDNQIIYVDFATLNSGSCNISQSFTSKLYVDNVLRATYTYNSLGSNVYTPAIDFAVGPLAAGGHTFMVVIDEDNSITETLENDNSWQRTIFVTAPPCANLTPYQPAGWDNKIVLSTVTGTHTSSSAFADNQSIYVDWAVVNNGSCNILQGFVTKVYLDMALIGTYSTGGLAVGSSASISDMVIGPLTAGSHAFQITVDGNVDVAETDELDNSYSIPFTVVPGACANLVPYQASGYDDVIVASTVTGTHTSATTFASNQNIYIDWNIANVGSCNISQTFYTKFYVDNVLINSYNTPGLNSSNTAGISDINIGTLSPGSHNLQITVDGDVNVNESNEMDNSYNRIINVGLGACITTSATTAFNGNRTINTDFQSGTYILNDRCQAATIHVRDWNSTTAAQNPVEITSSNNTWSAGTFQIFGTSVLWAAKQAYNYYLNNHARASYDGVNGSIDGYINAVFTNPTDGSLYTDNATMSSTGGIMKVGLGSSGTLANSWCALDIIAHEYTHAVTGSTAGLQYLNESGALNESFSDMFGEATENYVTGSNDWKEGSDRSDGAIRSLSNPNIYFHPDTYLGTYWATSSFDNGGVHTNSGVQNYWFYLLSQGGGGINDNGFSYNVTGIGITKASKIAYRNLTQYLNATSGYSNARSGSIQAAEDLYGIGSVEAEAVKDAWCAVGVGSCTANCTTPAVVTVAGGGTFCNSTTLTASGGSGGTIYWQGTTNNGQSSTTQSTSQVVTTSGTYYFRAKNSCGIWGPQGSVTVNINAGPNNWTGAVSTAWENPANWACGVLPDANTNVVISSGSVILNSNGICRSLTLQQGVHFTVNPGFKLTVMH